MSRDLDQTSLKKYQSLISTLKGHEEFLLDANGIIISTNLEAVNITGYEEYQVIGKHLSLFYTNEEKAKATKDLERSTLLKSIVVSGLKLKKRGSTFWAKMKISFEAEKNSPVFFKVTLQDTTHRALSKLKGKSIRDEYLAIFNTSFVGFFKFRMLDHLVMMCNQKTLDIINRNDSNNFKFSDVFHNPLQFDQFISILEKERKVEGLQFLINDNTSCKDNWGLLSAKYFKTQGFVEGLLMDISEQHNQMMELQRVNRELDNFTYHASHDLRAPLTSMMGLINLGLKESQDKASLKYFEMLGGRVAHMDMLLKDLISVSYNSKAQIEYQQFNFTNEVDAILKSLIYPGHIFRIDLSINEDHPFATDAPRARTILRNLLSNAFKYYNNEEQSPFVGLKIRVKPSHVAIQLKDNGIGIEHENKQKIYNMFYRGTNRSDGTGLGLYIVKSMVEKLQGKIAVESTLRQGTTFLLTLPNQLKHCQEVKRYAEL